VTVQHIATRLPIAGKPLADIQAAMSLPKDDRR
jgi:hypothetical protein